MRQLRSTTDHQPKCGCVCVCVCVCCPRFHHETSVRVPFVLLVLQKPDVDLSVRFLYSAHIVT